METIGPFEVKEVNGKKVVVIPPLSKEKLDEIHDRVVREQQGWVGCTLTGPIIGGQDPDN